MEPLPLSLLAVEGAADLLEQGLTISEDVGAIFSLYWTQIFQSELYDHINYLATIFAVGCLLFFMMRWVYAAVHEDDYREPLRSLIWPLIVVALLANDGMLLGGMTRALRNQMNTVAEQTLEVTLLNVTLEEAIRGALAKGAVTAEVSAQIAQCQSLLGEEQIACLESANEQIQGTLNDFKSHWFTGAVATGAGSVFPWLDSLSSSVRGATEAYSTSGGSVGQGLAGFFGGFFGSQYRAIIHAFLMSWQWAFVNLIQISMLLTGLIGPSAVAASLLPFGGKPIFAWLTGFLSLGFAQICYNIIVGLAAVVILNANTFDTNGFLVLISILAPALALGLASGGGLAIFNIMLSGSAGMATMLVTRVGGVGHSGGKYK